MARLAWPTPPESPPRNSPCRKVRTRIPGSTLPQESGTAGELWRGGVRGLPILRESSAAGGSAGEAVDLVMAAVISRYRIWEYERIPFPRCYSNPVFRPRCLARPGASHGVDVNEAFQAGKVSGIPRIQRKLVSEGGGCNEQISEASATAAASPFQRSVDASVRTRHVSVTG